MGALGTWQNLPRLPIGYFGLSRGGFWEPINLPEPKPSAPPAVVQAPTLAAQPAVASLNVPILLYHYPPLDFAAQMDRLLAKGYTTIDLDTLTAALAGQTLLPAKPVIITFDDGFASQWQAFEVLEARRMKATFYIINSGEKSHYCIGSGRRYDQGYGCGDAYLSWDQVKRLDQSGLITIGSHTTDHLNLTSISSEELRFQMAASKAGLESFLGHPVRHFAYPYGSVNASTIAEARANGFITAVTTRPGAVHTYANILALARLRSADDLP